MPSLKKIAAELNVSYTLVSKVLSGRMGTTGASKATRQAILDKAEELDYEPNRLAVALKRGKKGVIGVFLHSMGVPGSEITPVFLTSLAHALDQSSYRLWLRFFKTDREFLDACGDRLTRDVDGVIVGGVEHPELIDQLREIDRNGLPVVSVFCEAAHRTLTTNIAVDYEAQCYLSAKHLIEKGCRRIAHFRILDLRYQGFIRAHREAGIPIHPELVISDPDDSHFFYIDGGERAARKLLESNAPFDGIVAESDAQAVGAVRVLLRQGLRVPQDVKVTGVDNSPLAEAAQVPLTSTTAEMEACGRLAVEMMLKKTTNKRARSVIVQPQLVIRASTL